MESESVYAGEINNEKGFEFDFDTLETKIAEQFKEKANSEIRIKYFISSEKVFANKVLESFKQARTDNPDKKIVFLFDIDETLAKTEFVKNEDGSDYRRVSQVRPTAVPLLEYLNTQSVETGILSSRINVEEQLSDPDQLHELEPVIDAAQIYSSREMDYEDAAEIINAHKDLLVGGNEINEEFQKRLKGTGSLEKIATLLNIIMANPDKVYLPVDDDVNNYTDHFKYGIALRSKTGKEDNGMFI